MKIVLYKIGYFVGNLFGVNDEWNGIKENMVFLTEDEVKKLFKKFEIVSLVEQNANGLTGLGGHKHWHVFNVVAKKV